MKYVRTKDGKIYCFIDTQIVGDTIIGYVNDNDKNALDGGTFLAKENVIAQEDAIEKMCDEFDIVLPAGIYRFGIYHARYEGWGDFKRAWRDFKEKNGDDYRHYEILGAYGAIWTDKGLIYVAKMNDKGELELL